MKNPIIFLGAALILNISAFASDAPLHETDTLSSSIQTESTSLAENSNLQVSPEVFSYHNKSSYYDRHSPIKYSVLGIFGGIRISTDKIQPQKVYYGSNALLALGRFKSSLKICDHDAAPVFQSSGKTSSLYSNAEQRIGYSFKLSKTIITPLLGLGLNYINTALNKKNSYSVWAYTAYGIMINQRTSENLNLRFTFKALRSLSGTTKYLTNGEPKKRKIGEAWGYEAALPVAFQFSKEKKWSLKIQPYILKYDLRTTAQIYGFTFKMNYHF